MRLKIPCTIRLPLLGALTVLGLGSAHAQGDACAAAVNLTVSGNYVADGPSAGAGASNICYGTGANNADWYKFTAFDNGNATVSSCADAGGIDTVRERLDDDLDSPGAVAAIDRAAAGGVSTRAAAALLGVPL